MLSVFPVAHRYTVSVIDEYFRGIDLYFDGAAIESMRVLRTDPLVRGFTTNPSLIKAAGVSNYFEFSREAVSVANPLPISLEVLSDDLGRMFTEAIKLHTLGENVYVKIPITNTKGLSTCTLIERLSGEGIKLNVTAIFTQEQVFQVIASLNRNTPAILSIFAGRIADTGVDPVNICKETKQLIKSMPNIKLLWASPREILNIFQARDAGCDIITMTSNLWERIDLVGKRLEDFSLETVRMFFNDAKLSGFQI